MTPRGGPTLPEPVTPRDGPTLPVGGDRLADRREFQPTLHRVRHVPEVVESVQPDLDSVCVADPGAAAEVGEDGSGGRSGYGRGVGTAPRGLRRTGTGTTSRPPSTRVLRAHRCPRPPGCRVPGVGEESVSTVNPEE